VTFGKCVRVGVAKLHVYICAKTRFFTIVLDKGKDILLKNGSGNNQKY